MQSTWLTLDDAAVTADTPVPFDINSVWHALDRENNETREVKADPTTACLVDAGDPATLKSAKFKPHGGGSTPPHQSGTYGAYARAPDLLRLGLKDPRLRFFCGPKGDPQGSDPLEEVMLEWLGHSKPVSVLDFSGVPNDVADLAIGVVINLIFEAALRSKTDGIGRPRPVLIVLEEAHRYLGDDAAAVTREAANRIAREGRKYGIGLLLVTQRPSELPDTALAQCGTIISLRLTNSRDQGGIRAALPDAVSGLAEVLPSLRTGEALISGEAIVLPSRALIDLPDPEPDAQDPSLTPWREDPPRTPNLKPALNAWRGTYEK